MDASGLSGPTENVFAAGQCQSLIFSRARSVPGISAAVAVAERTVPSGSLARIQPRRPDKPPYPSTLRSHGPRLAEDQPTSAGTAEARRSACCTNARHVSGSGSAGSGQACARHRGFNNDLGQWFEMRAGFSRRTVKKSCGAAAARGSHRGNQSSRRAPLASR